MKERQQRVSQLIKDEVSILLGREEMMGIVTVTGIDLSPNYRVATIWISVLGSNGEETIALLSKKLPEFQSIINKRLTLKNVPRLQFKEDQSHKYVQNINKLFGDIKKKDEH